MTNLLEETKEILKEHGKSLSDIKFVYTDEGCFIANDQYKFMDAEYDAGYGIQEVRPDLKLVGENFWIERSEYDGREWWEFKEVPKFTYPPENKIWIFD